jgi:hypothetical protein
MIGANATRSEPADFVDRDVSGTLEEQPMPPKGSP